ncbi:MAG: hypothetical protein HY544_00530 [Candidatus Diapherotrites archaeon]|uniref:CAAX prenyl protease 2/Lysostaphin resistance protein A-like domain-containing protein n=1 Tax=Candidatus Iainarchaeum sp. TaxID=3101447 RepID=A0A8T3YLN6_9ARCH|nr:hypothetical protein [Candidatus Diapherotrites archaeon]
MNETKKSLSFSPEQANMLKQNIIKNVTAVLVSIVFGIWVFPRVQAVDPDSLINAFFFLSIFPLGAMFAYFAFNYGDTRISILIHRVFADVSSFIFLIVIFCSLTFATVLGIIAYPSFTFPFMALSAFLILGCVAYDFWQFMLAITTK